MKKRALISVLSIGVLILLAQVLLTVSGWYSEMVPWHQKMGGFSTGWDPSFSGGEHDHTDHKEITIGNNFYTIPDTEIQYHINATVNKGTADVMVYDITDAGLGVQETDKLELVYSTRIEESGIFDLDLSELPENRIYLITVFENEGSDFYLETYGSFRLKRWMYIHDRYLSMLPFVDARYNPEEW